MPPNCSLWAITTLQGLQGGQVVRAETSALDVWWLPKPRKTTPAGEVARRAHEKVPRPILMTGVHRDDEPPLPPRAVGEAVPVVGPSVVAAHAGGDGGGVGGGGGWDVVLVIEWLGWLIATRMD